MMPILTLLFYLALFVVVLFIVGLSFFRAHMAQASGIYPKVFVQMLIFYGVFLTPFAVIAITWHYFQGTVTLTLLCMTLALVALYLYARVIEPKMLKIHHHDITLSNDQRLAEPVRLAVLADIHLGLFSAYERQLAYIVQKVNALKDIDAVVFSGDWTYEPGADIVSKLMLLKNINAPCYHVLGNHDEQEPGPDITAELLRALDILQIKNIEALSIDLKGVNLVGVGDLWASKAEFSHFSAPVLNDKPSVILAHNPDTVAYIPDGLFTHKPLMISGHTHGGQVYVPLITPYLFKKHSATGYVEGLYQHPKAQVFVTAGTGMVLLPFRINMPPRIDILTLH